MLRITTLIENSPGEHHGLKNEHGISFFIEKDGHKILFDSGQSGAFLSNAAKMNIDLSDLEHVVLSHGHYDHSGGFRSLCSVARSFTLWTGEGFFTPKYAFRNGAYDYLGNDFDESFLSMEGISHSILSAPLREILPGVFLLTNFPGSIRKKKSIPGFSCSGTGSSFRIPSMTKYSLQLRPVRGWQCSWAALTRECAPCSKQSGRG